MSIWIGRPVVYRVYDPDGVLLYVGFSQNIEGRAKVHLRSRKWNAARIKVELAPDRATGLARESEVIRTELPLHNCKDHPHRDLALDYWSQVAANRRALGLAPDPQAGAA